MYLEDLSIEYSKTNRATCRGCKNKILIGEPRLGVESLYDEEENIILFWSHLLCFTVGKKFKDINPILIKGYENLTEDHKKQIVQHFQSGGVKRNVAKKKKPRKNKLKAQKRNSSQQHKQKRRSNKRKSSGSVSSTLSESDNSDEEEEDSESYSNDEDATTHSNTSQDDQQNYNDDDDDDDADEEQYNMNKNRRENMQRRSKSVANKKSNHHHLSEIDEGDEEEFSSISKHNKNTTKRNKIAHQKCMKDKQNGDKSQRKRYTLLGYTYKQYEEYIDILDKLEQKSDDELRTILTYNKQSTYGNRDKLLHQCADGKLLGAIPKCSSCKQGQLVFNYNDGVYKCSGYQIDGALKICSKKYEIEDIKRLQWVDQSNNDDVKD